MPSIDSIKRLAYLNKFAESVYAANPENRARLVDALRDAGVAGAEPFLNAQLGPVGARSLSAKQASLLTAYSGVI